MDPGAGRLFFPPTTRLMQRSFGPPGEALTYRHPNGVQAFWFDPEAGRGTGYFVTDDPRQAQAALRHAGLSTEIVAREVEWACRAPDDGNVEPPAA